MTYNFPKVLTIGPDFHNHRGGIEAVVEIYNKYIENFKFIASTKEGNSLFKSIIFIRSIFQLIYLLIFDQTIKLVHIHGASNGSFLRKFSIFLISKYLFGKKIIYHIHGGGFSQFYQNSNTFIRRLIRFFIENSDVIICLSESWKQFYLENFNIKKIFITPNIIDYPMIMESIEQRDILTFLFLGLICDNKGIFDLVDVMNQNKEKFKNKIQLIIGGNGEVSRLNNKIKKLQLEDSVKFVGWITNHEKIYWLNKSDIYILPSYKEGLPISILEAMSYGQAIIASKVGGIPEIVFSEKNGILIEPGNLKDIENAINFFLEDPEKIELYGQYSIQVAKKHQPDFVIHDLSVIYQSILHNN